MQDDNCNDFVCHWRHSLSSVVSVVASATIKWKAFAHFCLCVGARNQIAHLQTVPPHVIVITAATAVESCVRVRVCISFDESKLKRVAVSVVGSIHHTYAKMHVHLTRRWLTHSRVRHIWENCFHYCSISNVLRIEPFSLFAFDLFLYVFVGWLSFTLFPHSFPHSFVLPYRSI